LEYTMANNKWTGYFKVVAPAQSTTKMTDSQEMADVGAYNNYTWYQRLIQGSASRMTRYREYDLMDNDVEVARALDTIAEEMTGEGNPNSHLPLEIQILTNEEDPVASQTVVTVRAALRRWCRIHDWDNRLFHVARLMVKYGDVFFRKTAQHEEWTFIHPKNVVAALVDAVNAKKVVAWQVKVDITKPRTGGYSMPLGAKQDTQMQTEIVPADEIVRFTMNNDMSDTAPFGESVLRPVYRSHKQKELLEDSVLIYRIQRAPERRAFYIDVGKLPPQRVKAYLEQVKNEIRQKKVPSVNGGQMEIDSVYNPMQMSEDFFFASRPDGRGTKVDVLPGGQGLGELSDLEYFQRKVWRGLRVPASYMIEQSEGGQIWNDGKVGVAYIQELRFCLFVMRLQASLQKELDKEFKLYLRSCGIQIDETMYEIRLPDPSNFGKYKQLEIDGQLLSTYGTADSIQYMSKRFILKKYLQLSEDEIILNERMLREERGLDPNDDDISKLYTPPVEGAMPMGGGFGGAPMGMSSGNTMPGMDGQPGMGSVEAPASGGGTEGGAEGGGVAAGAEGV
jgi:hypothetical protein